MTLDTWIDQMEAWYETRKHDQEETLESLILSAPHTVWGPIVTPRQSKAIACWLDGCLRIYHHSQYRSTEKAYQYLQLAYSQLQNVVCEPRSELALKDWCMKRMQHLAVLTLEFCNQQHPAKWQQQSHQLIEAHVQFMAAQAWNEVSPDSSHAQIWNDDQGKTSIH